MTYPVYQKNLKFYLFADDTNIYCDCDTLTNVTKIVNKELKSVKMWLDVNWLSLNLSKTNYIIFHSTTMKTPENTSIKIGRKPLAKAKDVKFLGLLLDEYLSWKFHLSELSKKLARTCGIFFEIRSLLSITTMIIVYNQGRRSSFKTGGGGLILNVIRSHRHSSTYHLSQGRIFGGQNRVAPGRVQEKFRI